MKNRPTAWMGMLALVLSPAVGFSQIADAARHPPGISSPGGPSPSTTPGGATASFAARNVLAVQPLAGPIDPASYRVGPGDALHVQIWGGVDVRHDVLVSAEGRIVVPTLGTHDVREKTLREVEELIALEAPQYYVDAQVAVTLAVLRVFKTFVLGEVRNPGIYPATAVTRVTQLLEEAGGVTPSGSLRRIELRETDRRDPPARTVDVSRFLYDGVLAQNPVVEDGMVIFVPVSTGTALVEGAVQRPGTYALNAEDSVGDLIAAAGGLTVGAAVTDLHLGRIGDDPRADGDETAPADLTTPVRDGDRITVPLSSGEAPSPRVVEDTVYVVGRVTSPGAYPYLRNRGILDYIGLAGGGDERAKLSGTLVHRREQRIAAGGVGAVQPGDMIEVPEKRFRWWQDHVMILTSLSTAVLSAVAISQTSR